MTMVGLHRGWSALRGWLLGLVVALCIVAVLAAPARAAASVYAVNSTTDAEDANPGDGRCADAGDNCTLRAAVQEANAHPNDPTGEDEITIPSGTYTLTIAGANEDASATGDLDITDDVKITGAGKDSTEVNGNKADRVFHNLSKTVEISGLTVKDGRAGRGGAFYNAGSPTTTEATLDNVRFTTNEANSDGGAIFNEGTVTGIDSEFTNNRALGSFGGAITQYSMDAKLDFTRTNFEGNTAPNNGGAINMNGTLRLDAASFTGNTSAFGSGGGVLIYQGHTTIDNTTFAGNSAPSAGGGGLYLNEVTGTQSTVTNSTFSGNEALYGGGIHNEGGGWVLTNVTVANNTGGGILSNGALTSKNSIFAHNNVLNCWGNFVSQGHNLSSDATCTGGGTDRTGVDPKLGELADNGGPTKTLALQDGSPAIDAADNTNAPTVDQRGVSRPQDGDGDGQALHDIGAFEMEDTSPCNIGEIESPVNDVSSADDPGMSAYKYGSRGVIPAKFRAVCNDDPIDTQAEADAHPMKLTLTELGSTPDQDAMVENTVTGSANTGELFRFDDAADHYIYNIGVKDLGSGTYKLTISEANGGATHDEWFSIK